MTTLPEILIVPYAMNLLPRTELVNLIEESIYKYKNTKQSYTTRMYLSRYRKSSK
jgi:hypothetical protein